MEDGVLAARALAGDSDAFSSLVEAHQLHVFNLAYRMLGRREDAEDAAQETFLRAYRQLATYRPDQRFSTWLMAICAHFCVDQLRRRRIDWVNVDDAADTLLMASRDPQPEESVLRREQSAELMALLRRLPPRYRLVTLLFYSYEFSIAEIARATSASEGAVKTQLCRARDMLAAEIMRDRGTAAAQVQPAPAAGNGRAGDPRKEVMVRAV